MLDNNSNKVDMEHHEDLDTQQDAAKRKKGWCERCQSSYTSSQSVHEQSLAHMFETSTGPRTRSSVRLPESNRGYRLLQGMGWREGQGLGVESQGRVEPVRTQFKRDQTGLGKLKYESRVTHFASHSGGSSVQEAVSQEPRAAKGSSSSSVKSQVRKRKKARAREQLLREKRLRREIYGNLPEGMEQYFDAHDS